MFRGKYCPVYDHPAARERSRRWLLTATTPIVHRDGKYSRRRTILADDGPWRRLRPSSTRAQQTMAPDGDYAHHLPPLRTTAERCMLWKPGEEGRTTHTWFVCRTPKIFLKNLVAEIYIRGVPALRSIKFNFKNYAVYIQREVCTLYNRENARNCSCNTWDYYQSKVFYLQLSKCLSRPFLRHWNQPLL